jgi:hypothetical protein
MCPTVARFYIGDHCYRAGYRLPGLGSGLLVRARGVRRREAAGAWQLGCCVERTHGALRHRGATIQPEVAHWVASVGTFRLLHNFASVAGVTPLH